MFINLTGDYPHGPSYRAMLEGEDETGAEADGEASETEASEGAEDTLLGGDGDTDGDGGDGADDDEGADDGGDGGGEDDDDDDGEADAEYEDDPELSDEENAEKKKEFDDAKAEAAKAKGDKANKDEPVDPASYEITVPDGFNLDEDLEKEFRKFSAKRKFTQEDVDELTGIQKRLVSKQAEGIANLKKTWVKDLKADKEFGGQAFDANAGACRHIIDNVFVPVDPNFKSMLNSTGLGSYPGFVKGMKRIADALGEAGVKLGGKNSGDDSMEEVLYGDD